MSTSHPGRAGPDELVPSRYALQVGEIDVMVVSDGVLSLPGAMLGQRRPGRPGGLARRHVPAAGRARVGAERGRGAWRRPDHTHRRRDGGGVPGLAAEREADRSELKRASRRRCGVVRFAPKSGQTGEGSTCPLCAKRGHNLYHQRMDAGFDEHDAPLWCVRQQSSSLFSGLP